MKELSGGGGGVMGVYIVCNEGLSPSGMLGKSSERPIR